MHTPLGSPWGDVWCRDPDGALVSPAAAQHLCAEHLLGSLTSFPDHRNPAPCAPGTEIVLPCLDPNSTVTGFSSNLDKGTEALSDKHIIPSVSQMLSFTS